VNEFVAECLREWKRLGVPDPVASEMAADLAADLEEAEAEGASAEEVLGSGAFDARSFAAAWAAERGLVRRPSPSGPGRRRRFRLVAAITAFALIATTGAVLVILASPSAPRRLAVASPGEPPRVAYARSPDGLTVVGPLPAPPPAARTVVVGPESVPLSLAAPVTRIVAVDVNDSGVATRTVGSVLLTVGLAGILALTLFWLWVGRGQRVVRIIP
jgi:hypothetical protein